MKCVAVDCENSSEVGIPWCDKCLDKVGVLMSEHNMENKNMKNKFVKIKRFGDRSNENVLNSVVELTEKIDCSNFSFHLKEGVLKFRSHNKELGTKEEEGKNWKNWSGAIEYITEKHEANPFPAGCVFFGECMVKSHTIKYGDTMPFIGFAVYDTVGEIYEEEWFKYYDERDIPTPKRTYLAGLSPTDLIETYGEIESQFGTITTMVEGFVVKNYELQEFAKYYKQF